MLTALAQEPWCFDPGQIARLTDWQVVEMYLRPAADRAEKLRRETPGGAAVAPEPPPPHDPAVREQAVEFMVGQGIPRAQAEADYDGFIRRLRGE